MSHNCYGICQVETPFGMWWLAANERGICRLTPQRITPGELTTIPLQIAQHLALATKELAAYFRGDLMRFSVALDINGTPFQQQVWRQLCAIPYGERCSYGELAATLGRPNAYRAVGTANGANRIGIIIPCHRVVGSNGKLTGYAHGLEVKQYLLNLETSNPSR
ncbi:methylated-DNA--[protein]-cysteine S-methyltransferase [Shewanella sp. NIFS-20-20]|uniref:methylated-DNA--[protein]-cysteine S-methyltransferase n=1 Tax=Shewanella sp. NIFS-20-20 TaxID=2853806 RepID=UPI001C472AFE|nr:methylated-DNA--[protein]-cysteine S-methyltransferase [Shewanella sp. NIFS-20-20]MBV7314972.1 methylated-DNA--[protein]-cysteine S-methyltransferase [Shewanella sp. NIFS-20-20]